MPQGTTNTNQGDYISVSVTKIHFYGKLFLKNLVKIMFVPKKELMTYFYS